MGTNSARHRDGALDGPGSAAHHFVLRCARDTLLSERRHDRNRTGAHFIVGMTNSAPSLMPEGQREVTVLVLV